MPLAEPASSAAGAGAALSGLAAVVSDASARLATPVHSDPT